LKLLHWSKRNHNRAKIGQTLLSSQFRICTKILGKIETIYKLGMPFPKLLHGYPPIVLSSTLLEALISIMNKHHKLDSAEADALPPCFFSWTMMMLILSHPSCWRVLGERQWSSISSLKDDKFLAYKRLHKQNSVCTTPIFVENTPNTYISKTFWTQLDISIHTHTPI
jgi:hypothetical protein